jgi:hypothetical protein
MKNIPENTFIEKSYLNKTLFDACNEHFNLEVVKIRKNHFYIIVDETPDFLGHKLLNILVGTLKEGF